MKVINTYIPSIPSFAGAPDDVNPMYVLTEDDMGQLAVYVGLVDCSVVDVRYTQRREDASYTIASGGAKLSYRQALGMFPTLDEARYRR